MSKKDEEFRDPKTLDDQEVAGLLSRLGMKLGKDGVPKRMKKDIDRFSEDYIRENTDDVKE